MVTELKGTPSVSATSWACVVGLPDPMSFEPVITRTDPSSAMATNAEELPELAPPYLFIDIPTPVLSTPVCGAFWAYGTNFWAQPNAVAPALRAWVMFWLDS